MFNKVNKDKVARTLGISIEGLDEFLKRQKGFLIKREKLSASNLLASYFILAEIQEREEKERTAKSAMRHTKNVKVLKYAKTITDLYKGGLGATRIVNYLYEKHRVTVSKSAVERFIKASGITRDS